MSSKLVFCGRIVSRNFRALLDVLASGHSHTLSFASLRGISMMFMLARPGAVRGHTPAPPWT